MHLMNFSFSVVVHRFLRTKWTAVAVGAVFSAAAIAADPAVGTVVRVQTSAGPIDVALYDASAPRTVGNFLSYVRSGAYDGSFFHRLVRGFVLQGGGLRWDDGVTPPLGAVPVTATLVNEFSATRSNVRGTVAMAKVAGNPDSATNQWFVNLADNSANLDTQNGGFTVFGRVLTPSMKVVDALAGLSMVKADGCTNLGALASAMSSVPVLRAVTDCSALSSAALVSVQRAHALPARLTLAPAERVFNYLEAAYPDIVAPASVATQQGNGFVFRYYPQTNTYLGVMQDQLYALAPALTPHPILLGPITTWLSTAESQGY